MTGKSEEKQQRSTLIQGKYELGRVLGHGTFGKVYLARNVETGKSVAMKVVGKDKVIRVGMVEQLKREISVMRKVKHPNIVELHEVLASKTKIYLAMELVRGGELFSQVAKGKLPEDLARSYFSQLVSAVDFCHSRGVYHRDLKLENLLLDEQDSDSSSSSSSDSGGGGSFPVLKVTDFGLSAFAAGGDPLQTTCGTPAYVAPEVITKKGYDGAKADIWSCGVILYALLAGFLPFQDDNLMAMYRKIYKADFKCPPWMSRDARKLITRLLDPNPRTRATIPEIMESPWLNPKPNPPVVVVDLPPLPPHKSSAESQGKSGAENGDGDEEEDEESQQPEILNAFHIISLSQGFNLSPLFEEKKRAKSNNLIFEADKKDDDGGGSGDNNNDDDNNDELRFATAGPASTVISKLEQVAANTEGRFQLLAVPKKKSASVADLQSYGGGKGSSVDQQVRRISSGDGLAEGCCASRGGVMRVLQGKQSGRKGKLSIAAEIFSIAPSVVVVEVRKHHGDTLEYNRFCNQELRPALKDILWKSSSPAAG